MNQIKLSRNTLLLGLLGVFVVLLGVNVYIAALKYDGGSFVEKVEKSVSPEFLSYEVLQTKMRLDSVTKISSVTDRDSDIICILRTYELRPRDEGYDEASHRVYNYIVQNQDYIGEGQWGLYFLDGQNLTPAKYINTPQLMLWPDTPLPAYILKAMPENFVRRACASSRKAGFYKFNLSDVSYLVFGSMEE